MKAGESSTVVAFRALVMLACLILVPLAAIFGSACPDLVRKLLIEPLLGSQIVSELFGQIGGAAPLGEGPAANSGGPPAAEIGVAPPWPGNGEPAGLGTDGSSSGNAAPLQPAPSFGGPAKEPGEGALVRFDAPVEPPTSNPWPRFGGTPSEPANTARPSQNAAAPAASDLPGVIPPSVDRFSVLERRLRDYGAIYYLLETWGGDGELYRFHCKMAIANNPNFTRHFEATHREALQAMTQVLEQIEAWRAGRLK